MHKPTDPTQEGSGAPTSSAEAAATTGHARNVLANWAGSMVFVVSGFVVPRFIDSHMGSELLGIWDLGWSLVAYVSLLSLGIASAVNRYVSRHRATGTWSDLNRTTNSCLAVLLAAGGLGLVLTVAFVFAVPWLMSESAAGLQATARWVILALGCSAALQLPASVFNGVITGCERFDRTGENVFSIRLTAKVGPVKAHFNGEVSLLDIDAPHSYTISGSGKGGIAGFARGSVFWRPSRCGRFLFRRD